MLGFDSFEFSVQDILYLVAIGNSSLTTHSVDVCLWCISSNDDTIQNIRHLLVLIECDFRSAEVRQDRLCRGDVSASFHVTKHIANLFHHFISIEISNYGYSLILWLVPTLIEILDKFCRTVLNDFHVADRIALRID